MYHHLEFKYLNLFYVDSFHAHLSHAPSCSYHSLFSSSPARSLHVSPILANMVSRCLPWEVSHTSLSLYITRFSLSRTSLPFSRITRYLSFLFHRQTHSLHSSFTLSFSLWDSLTHPICLYIWLIPLKLLSLSLSHVDTTFVGVSFSSPSQTDIIHLFTDQTTPTIVSSLSLTDTHAQLLPLKCEWKMRFCYTQTKKDWREWLLWHGRDLS